MADPTANLLKTGVKILDQTQVFTVHSIQRQSKPRKSPCSKWEHDRFRYLSELISLESAALLAVQVEAWNNVDGGWGATRLSGVLYRNVTGLYWREGWMAESLVLASADDGFDQVFRAHVRELLYWTLRFRGSQKRPSIVVSERRGFEVLTRDLSDEHQRWLERLRKAAQCEAAPGTLRWDRW
ncbi:hypothetical protein WMO33_21330 (plasmid) [Xanthomonas oryzae pv. oryzicola]|uniref:hypothetical protein n=1 Tax=Xanthomonas oryzae TaxID=347 RepID=UPI00349E8B36